MAESLENLDNILHDWKKISYKKAAGTITGKMEEEAVSFVENDPEKYSSVSVGSRARLNQTQNFPCFLWKLINTINKMFTTLIYWK